MQGDYDGKLKSRGWKLQMHLASKPAKVSLNRKPAAWNYDSSLGIVMVNWKAATKQASEVEIDR